MSLKTDKEQQFQLGSREGRLHLIKRYFIPALDAPKWGEKYKPDADSVEQSAHALAEEYHDLAVPMLYSTAILVISLSTIDYLVALHAQVYGLFLNVWSGVFFAFPSLKGRYVIASIVDGKEEEALRKLEAQEMASNNVGIALLATGFFVQIWSAQFLPKSEFLRANIAVEMIPEWAIGVLLVLALIICGKALKRFRDRRISGRDDESD